MRENLVGGNTKEFIITYGKPHKLASSYTISRWIKDELGMAGIKTSWVCRTVKYSKDVH